jgi:hypothetical protein
MKIEEAMNCARLWRAGKLIGGDADEVRDALLGEIERLSADKKRVDWLADKNNTVGNVQLPSACVIAHPDSLRAAIDMAMLLPPNAK